MTSVSLRTAPGIPLWRAAQIVGLVLTLALVGTLWVLPALTLRVLWDMVIPLLPAVFLVNPLLWRNVCPLATLNELSGSRPPRRAMPTAVVRRAWVIGIVLLFALVPARRFLFNENGPALAIVVGLVAALAFAAGGVFAGRAGFCMSVCPVLPVEKLYGQAPILTMNGARCSECTLCTSVGCQDLAATKTVAQTIGPLRRGTGWLRTSFGVFAASFPGFIVGYFTSVNGGLSSALPVYVRVLGFAVASYAVVTLLAASLRLRSAQAMPALGALSLGLYYWYAAPGLTEAYGGPDGMTMAVRAVMGGVLLWWLTATLARANGRLGRAAEG